MVISHTHRFAFIHIPRTAGCSVSVALGGCAEPVMQYWANRWLDQAGIHVNHYAPLRWRRFRLHTSAAILRRQVPAACFDGLFKFTFVRNPWELLVSHYRFVANNPAHHRNRLARRLESFERYVDYEIRRDKISQSRMVTDHEGRLLVDFVGRMESLERDFATICRRIGVEARLPHLNRSAGSSSVHDDYREHYTAPLIDRVANHFAEDIARFGYTFEGSAATGQSAAAAGCDFASAASPSRARARLAATASLRSSWGIWSSSATASANRPVSM